MSATTARDLIDEGATAFDGETTVQEAIDRIRTSASDSEQTIYYAYVLEGNRPCGVVSMRGLLNADDDTQVSEIATESVVVVDASDSLEHVVDTFANEGFPVLPVVDDDETFLGIVRASDVISALDDEDSKEALAGTVRDVAYDPGEETTYECFNCGEVITSVENPGACPSCGSEIRHRQTPME